MMRVLRIVLRWLRAQAGPVSRILLRVLAGALMAKGWLSPSGMDFVTNDHNVAMVAEAGLGFALWAVAEGWYGIAKRMGWPT